MAVAQRVLVVDDDDMIRELLRLHLSNAGYEVTLAPDPVVAIQELMRAPPDLMIVDMQMPYMTGLELVAAIRGDTVSPDVPVIFLTSADEYREQAAPLLPRAFLLKPVLASALLSEVAKVFRQIKAAA